MPGAVHGIPAGEPFGTTFYVHVLAVRPWLGSAWRAASLGHTPGVYTRRCSGSFRGRGRHLGLKRGRWPICSSVIAEVRQTWGSGLRRPAAFTAGRSLRRPGSSGSSYGACCSLRGVLFLRLPWGAYACCALCSQFPWERGRPVASCSPGRMAGSASFTSLLRRYPQGQLCVPHDTHACWGETGSPPPAAHTPVVWGRVRRHRQQEHRAPPT